MPIAINEKMIEKAVADYAEFNKGGYYDPHYGYLMFDRSTGAVWTDEYYDLSHKSYTEYQNKDIVNIGSDVWREYGEVTVKSVADYIKVHCL